MKSTAVLLCLGLLAAAPAYADGDRLGWPLRPRPAVTRAFDAPAQNWNRGHRGVDLAAAAGQTVHAAAAGTVVFAGELAGRPLVSIAHPGGLRTTYEPVDAAVRVGQLVDAGSVVGVVLAGHPGCGAAACLHWGAMWGPASRADYVDPLGLVVTAELRLKPVDAPGRAPRAAAPR
ncbi:M23 family metallopeptidase [Mycobacterium yunnanensis]|uniref:M23 family metallopeptidase n=1 Tax=Mycobacterium yunnanensis TaxID=368477 RepID=A0A9X2Z6W8_9MYCO|nr:M23 family metallopeptidase [Mycobacterium yunnanensis]MCV7423421.1 M23 family metallopeptidase [Mycobacterium yunnanensis]